MNNLLYFLSRTDRTIVMNCPPYARAVRQGLGVFVLLTGVLAWISGSYAISNMFLHESPDGGPPVMTPGGWLISAALGLVYAVFIMAIDREVVAATSRKMALVRLPLVAVISVVISKPVEMRLFGSSIEQQLKQKTNYNDSIIRYDVSVELRKLEDEINKMKTLEKNRMDSASAYRYMADMEAKGKITGQEGEGKHYKRAMANAYRFDSLAQISTSAVNDLKNMKSRELVRADSLFKIRRKRASYDILAKMNALSQLKKDKENGHSTRTASWLMTLLFFLLECSPLLVKILSGKTEYDVQLQARTQLNTQVLMAVMDRGSWQYSGQETDLARKNRENVQELEDSQAWDKQPPQQ